MNKLLPFIFVAFAMPATVWAQKKVLTHDDYDQWKSIKTYTISADGSTVVYQINPQQGDGNLYIYNTAEKTTVVMPRGDGAQISWDANYVVFKVLPLYAEVREAKRKELKKDEMPKNDVVIYNVKTGATDTIKNASGFKMPKENEGWVAIKLSPPQPSQREEDTLKQKSENQENAKLSAPSLSPPKAEGRKGLLLRTLDGSKSDTLNFVDSYSFAKTAAVLLYNIADKKHDSIKGVYTYADGNIELLDSNGTKFTQLTINDDATKMAWLLTQDSAKAEVKKYSLKIKMGEEIVEVDSSFAGMPNKQMPSEYKQPVFSEDGSTLFFEYRKIPVAEVKDTMALKEEEVSLDIWSWTDTIVMPAQLHRLKQDKEKGWLAAFDLESNKLTVLESHTLPNVSYNPKHLTEWLAATDDRKNRLSTSWNYPTAIDLYIVNLKTGERKLMVSNVQAGGSISPAGKYLYGYSKAPKEWHAIEIATGKKIKLNHFKTPVWNIEHDSPALPGSYGFAGWGENDEYIVIYDEFDLWKVELENPGKPINLTNGMGRKTNTRYRYERLDRDEVFLPETLLLNAFDETTKREGYYTLNGAADGIKLSEVIAMEGSYFMGLTKAKNAETLLFRKGNFVEDLELYVAEKLGAEAVKISETNPQQKEYNWGTIELVHWKGKKGVGNLDGLLIKPENFDENKKYPVLIYFYERYSDLLNYHFDFKPSASTINFPYFASNGYIIFVPDIVYEDGHPGKSAYNCVVSGAEWLAKKPWVDETKMAIQGQSWGGYQVAYLVTQTDMFACAMAGAPVSNMTSAYGGIRWGSGWSREFQYEKTQSRIGGTLWEARDLYIENSPVFFADQVNTPLLMMHNDNDGAVPWYQGIEYFMALRRLQKPAWLLVYNNEAHNLKKRHNRKDLSVRMAQFFNFYLKGEEAPDWLKEGRKAVEK